MSEPVKSDGRDIARRLEAAFSPASIKGESAEINTKEVSSKDEVLPIFEGLEDSENPAQLATLNGIVDFKDESVYKVTQIQGIPRTIVNTLRQKVPGATNNRDALIAYVLAMTDAKLGLNELNNLDADKLVILVDTIRKEDIVRNLQTSVLGVNENQSSLSELVLQQKKMIQNQTNTINEILTLCLTMFSEQFGFRKYDDSTSTPAKVTFFDTEVSAILSNLRDQLQIPTNKDVVTPKKTTPRK